MKIRRNLECLFQTRLEFLTIDFDGPELPQMLGNKLRNQQDKDSSDEASAQMNQCDRRYIAFYRKHAFATERAAQGHDIKATNQPCAFPDFQLVEVSKVD